MRFLLVDRIEEIEPGRSARGFKNAAMTEDYFEWHFPGRPIVPGVLILEALSQLAGWVEAAGSEFGSWFLLDKVSSARYYSFAVPGDRLDLTVKALECDDPDRRVFEGESTVAGKRSAIVTFEGRVVPLEGLEAADRARHAYALLRGEEPDAGD
jgi:3-hydroxyacyl-[acyl-carrier-protein] dehydratase